MADKSPRRTMSKKSEKTLKQKRAERKSKSGGTDAMQDLPQSNKR